MESRAHALAADIRRCSAASALAVFWLSGKREATNEYILVTQKSVSGLNTQAQVRFRGLRAGKVLDIELDPKNPLNILITISLDASMPVTKGTTAKLNYQGVTGLASVLLEDKGENLEPLTGVDGELPRIELQPNFAFPGENAADLMAQMRQVASAPPRFSTRTSSASARRWPRRDGHGRSLRQHERPAAGDGFAQAGAQRGEHEAPERDGGQHGEGQRRGGAADRNLQGVSKTRRAAGRDGREITQTTLPRLNVLLQELSVNSARCRVCRPDRGVSSMLIFDASAPTRPGRGGIRSEMRTP